MNRIKIGSDIIARYKDVGNEIKRVLKAVIINEKNMLGDYYLMILMESEITGKKQGKKNEIIIKRSNQIRLMCQQNVEKNGRYIIIGLLKYILDGYKNGNIEQDQKIQNLLSILFELMKGKKHPKWYNDQLNEIIAEKVFNETVSSNIQEYSKRMIRIQKQAMSAGNLKIMIAYKWMGLKLREEFDEKWRKNKTKATKENIINGIINDYNREVETYNNVKVKITNKHTEFGTLIKEIGATNVNSYHFYTESKKDQIQMDTIRIIQKWIKYMQTNNYEANAEMQYEFKWLKKTTIQKRKEWDWSKQEPLFDYFKYTLNTTKGIEKLFKRKKNCEEKETKKIKRLRRLLNRNR